MAVPTFTAEAALTPADARVARAFAMPRPADAQGAAAGGEPCDLSLYAACTASGGCQGRTGADYSRCLQEVIDECRREFGCATGLQCSPGGPGSICCPTAQTNCGGTCRALGSDPANCGACGAACPPGWRCCGGTCRDMSADAQNCGSCGNVCTGGKICASGVCVCPSGLTDCSGTCRNLNTDAQNCGGCGNIATGEHICTGGKICQGGFCVCPTGLTDCSGNCRNLNTDAQNCGGCGNIATGEHICTGGKTCQNGHCICPPPLADCDGQCVDFYRDTGNCGACGTACSAGQKCCNFTCTDVQDNVLHCGACFRICRASCSGERRCNAGVCTEPQTFRVALADPTTGCVVASDERDAFSQSEADACVQGFYPNLKAGAPTGPYAFQSWCRGSLCEDWLKVPGLSQGDAQKCIEFYRPPPDCTVSPGPCANCGFLSNCGGKCVDRATDAAHCRFCDNPCPANTKCVNGWCV